MKLGKYIGSVAMVVLTAGLLTACGSRTTVESNLGIKGAPDWVNKGSQALNDQSGRLIQGIASAPGMNDLSLQTSTADDRARAEVARVLSSYMKVVSQDYGASANTGADQQSEQSVSRQIQAITEQNVSGARIIAHWKDPQNGTIWSLAELDMKQVKDMVAGSKDMNAGFQNYFASHADNLFDNMNSKGANP
jgi:hypothetical protein